MKRISNSGNRISLFAILILFGVIASLRFIYPPDNVLAWDVLGYYLYLPAKFIYHDLGLSNHDWLNKLIAHYHSTGTLYQAYIGPSGQWVMKYSMGMAVLYMPFFFIAHWLAILFGYPADGLSAPYQYGIAIGGLFYTLIGLVYFRKILLEFFNDRTTSIVLILTVLGTNVINQTSVGNLLSHNFLFTLFAVFMWYTIKWHENQKMSQIILLAFVCGLMTLVRPTEVVCLILPLLWGVNNKDSLIEKIQIFKEKKLQIIIGALCFIIILLPQFFYWKKQTGHFIFYSYSNAGEGLDLLSPHIGNFLFSFRKGWIIYTPLMMFNLFGLYLIYKRKKEIFLPIALYFIFSLYLISSWTCWWYASACYSQRAVLSMYLVLSIGLGLIIERLFLAKLYLKVLISFILFGIVTLNIFQFWQFHKNILKHDTMTMKYYFAIFGKTKIPENAEKLLLINRSTTGVERFEHEEGYHKKIIGDLSFTRPDLTYPGRYIKDEKDTSNLCLVMDRSFIYSPGLAMKYKNITEEYYAWVRVSVEVRYPKFYSDIWPVLVITFDHKGVSYKYFGSDLICKEEEKGEWKKLSFDYMTPEIRNKNDKLKVYVWQRGRKPFYLKNLVVQAFEPIIN